jgi:hypothetical protein
MPMYDIECPRGHQSEVLTKSEDRFPPCPECGEPSNRIWLRTSAGVLGDALDYVDHNLGPDPIHITSRSQRKQLMAKAGLQEAIRHVDGDKHVKRWV